MPGVHPEIMATMIGGMHSAKNQFNSGLEWKISAWNDPAAHPAKFQFNSAVRHNRIVLLKKHRIMHKV